MVRALFFASGNNEIINQQKSTGAAAKNKLLVVFFNKQYKIKDNYIRSTAGGLLGRKKARPDVCFSNI